MHPQDVQRIVIAAVRHEQKELRNLRSSLRSELATVRQFEEAWVQLAIVKQFLRDRNFRRSHERITAEYLSKGKRADICLFGKADETCEHPRARIELKGPGKTNPTFVRAILHDCRKLAAHRKERSRCAVALAYGSNKKALHEWASKTLPRKLPRRNTLLQPLPPPIALNKSDGLKEYLQVVTVIPRRSRP